MRAHPHSRILVVDDNLDILSAARILLDRRVGHVDTESHPGRLPELLAKHRYDVILLDMNFTRDVSSGREGFNWLRRILEIDSEAVVILITAYGDVDMAVRAIKSGATDFILKPWQNEKLCATISSALSLNAARRESTKRRRQQQQLSEDLGRPFDSIIGDCEAMQRLLHTIDKVAATDANVLIFGENGTGKEMVAREIHRRSGRAAEVFMAVDVGSLPESLFESELYGHTRGAFTGATGDRAGRFELTEGGTLFLDEIANISLALQSKLLSVVENRTITRLGSTSEVNVDIRLISATNTPLGERVAAGSFREDLYYRINTVEVVLPPLRDRGEDIPLLARHFLDHYARKYAKDIDAISDDAMAVIRRYHWPGNVRHLKHALERAVIMSSSGAISPSDLGLSTADAASHMTGNDSMTLWQRERAAVEHALELSDGNVTGAAKTLGITRASLYRRMKKYDL